MRNMARNPLQNIGDDDGWDGPYDGAQSSGPWFLPDTSDDAVQQPLPQADRTRLIDPKLWATAQADQTAELADLALLYGALEERLRAGPKGWRHRLALLEAAELSWALGDRISAERLGLWEALRLSGIQDDALGLARASWAVRRLAGGAVPGQGPTLAAFLGRHGVPQEIADFDLLAAEVQHLHPLTRAAALMQGWQLLGDGGVTTQMEAAVLASHIGAQMGRSEGGFVPQAFSGAMTLQAGSAQQRLALWLRGATRATLAALIHLDRVREWQDRAKDKLADLQGRTPALMVAILAEWPMVTSPMAEQIIGANKATILRNLALMQALGLVREVTGQGRYRVWTAKV